MRLEADLSAAYQRAAGDMEQQRQHYEGLLQRARDSQVLSALALTLLVLREN